MSNRTTKFAAFKLNSLNNQLSNSNQNLQQFAYTVSHDLKEPLRTVDGYLTLIDDRFSSELNAKGRKFLKRSRVNVKNMGHFIEDLLEFSRIDTMKKNFELFDSSILIDNVISKIQVLIQERGAKIIRNSLPTVFANPSLIEQVFQNLISNAIKFSNGKASEIIIQASEKENNWVFSVQDQGIGIDPKFFDAIFIVFTRLNSKTDYEGTGIGLSICKKIVEHHNGKIWVESTLDKGSTFFFTIPINND
jgi:light-regulated signal transduction histidine kinase (bacteriophytochrome)